MKTHKKLLALGIILSSQILPVAAHADNLVSSTGMNDIKTTVTVDGGSDSELSIGDGIVIDKEVNGTTDIPNSDEIDDNASDSTAPKSSTSDNTMIEQAQSTDVQEIEPQSLQAGKWGTATTEFDSDTGTITISNGELGAGDKPNTLNNSIKHIIFGDNVKFKPDATRLFSSYYNLITVSGQVDTANVTNMNSMFAGCTNLSSLDVKGWDTANVKNMSSMFSSGCTSLRSLDLSGWDTSNVITMQGMFTGCTSLSSLDVKGWDTSSMLTMETMFFGCTSLSSLDVSGWDTSNMRTMDHMFFRCTSLSSLDVSGWDTSNMTSLNQMFSHCTSLRSLDVSGWDTSNVTNMQYLFHDCSSLRSLDLRNWNTSNVTEMIYIFKNTVALGKISLGENSIFDSIIGELDTALPEINTSSGNYTGHWINTSTGHTYDTSVEFMSNYDGSQPGTYIWETDSVTIDANNSVIYTGDTWNAEDNFISAMTSVGTIYFSDVTVEGSVDTSKAGTYPITYRYGSVTKEVTVTVLENQESVTTKDSTLYVGDNWTAKDNFISATDKDGNPIDFDNVTVDGTVDTTKAGANKVTYSWQDTDSDGHPTRETISSEAIITVKVSETEDSENETTSSGNTTSTNKGNASTKPMDKPSNQSSKLPSTGEQSSMVANAAGLALLLLAGGMTLFGLKKKKSK